MLTLSVILYLSVTVFIGIYSSKFIKNSSDFIVAGRRLPFFMASSALFATWFGSETILGASAEFANHGLMGVVEDPFGAALCLILVGVFFARPLYRMNIRSFGDFYRIKFGSKTEWVASVCIILSYFGWIAAQFVALGILLEAVTGIHRDLGMIIGALAVCVYTWFGGLWAVAITDSIQTVVIVAGLLIISVIMTSKVPDLAVIPQQLPEGFFRFYPVSFSEGITYFAAWITIGLGSIPQQDIFQRVMASKSERVAVRSSYMGGVMYLTIGMMPLYIALLAKIDAPDVVADQHLLPAAILSHGSLPLQVLFYGALISAILSTSSGAILAPATVLEENIWSKLFRKKSTDKRQLRYVRYSIVVIALLSLFMAFEEKNIYHLVASSSALSLVSLFVPLVAGLYFKRKNETAALSSIVSGMFVWILFEYLFKIDFPALLAGLGASVLGWVMGSLLVNRAAQK